MRCEILCVTQTGFHSKKERKRAEKKEIDVEGKRDFNFFKC